MKSLFPVFRFSGFISLFCINCSYFHVDKKSFNCNYVCKKSSYLNIAVLFKFAFLKNEKSATTLAKLFDKDFDLILII